MSDHIAVVIADSHCHAWTAWPYARDPDLRGAGTPERLLEELDRVGAQHALVVCARIGGGAGGTGWPNGENNTEIARWARTRADRISFVVDIDSWWSPTYHRRGAAERLREEAARTGARGVTHYLDDSTNDGWLRTAEASAFFAVAAERRLIVSVPVVGTTWLDDLRGVAVDHPDVPFLFHHLGLPRPTHLKGDRSALARIADLPNVGVKVSGFAYSSPPGEQYPYPTAQETLTGLLAAFGPHRLYWGSDWPVSTTSFGYSGALDLLRRRADLSDEDRARILGRNLLDLLAQPAPHVPGS